ncbi:MAG: ribosome biogenesis GTP-binding protein YihA/YsxC [Chitinispirillia bacterium]|nr:ribosome biogenesis GTP-binding protein YihA/YsxC [Chitinispirillia bacterium]MCL2267882.1 ribosome biogenesis GTP-binding protein YihA/YsxC [Chitinispirillia bacterium]
MSETQKKFSVQFVQSAAHFKELPAPAGEEYAVLGRSNVGKSTFINHALASGTLARVSKRPGKTTLANLYRLEKGLFWVDLPGYGFARASSAEKDRWGRLIADYCTRRDSLAGIIWLLDIRHPGIDADMEAHEWLGGIGLPVLPVLTKGDKLSRSAQKKHSAEFREIFGFEEEPVVYSSLEHGSRKRFWEGFDRWRARIGGPGGRAAGADARSGGSGYRDGD